MDRIVLTGLAVDAIVGIYPAERERRQPVVIDLEMAADVAGPAGSGDLADALDYEALANALAAHVADTSFELLEALAEDVAGFVRERFGVPWLRLTLHKPDALPGPVDVAVVIERGERPATGPTAGPAPDPA